MNFYQSAQELQKETIIHRRHLHQIPELGFDLDQTAAYVKQQLIACGYEVEEIVKNGLVAYLGDKTKENILLRADMDALPIEEKTELDYASKNGKMHACGHDAHTAVMLSVAKILKSYEKDLKRSIKFVFQPAEETLGGSEAMIEKGVLEGTKFAFAGHVAPQAPLGVYLSTGVSLSAANSFAIRVNGISCHGANPHTGIDPVMIACHILLGLQQIIVREVNFNHSAVITTGKFHAHGSANVIPQTVEIEGTLRTFTKETQDLMLERMPQVTKSIAEAFKATAELTFTSSVPPLVNDPELTSCVSQLLKDRLGKEGVPVRELGKINASEDFAYVSQKVPTVYFRFGMAHPNQENYPVHHPMMNLNEDGFATAVDSFCQVAYHFAAEQAE